MRFADQPSRVLVSLASMVRAMSAAMLVCAAPAVLAAQSPAPTNPAKTPAVHPLGPVSRVSASQFGSIASIRPLSTGAVLVNDITGRHVVLLDSTLANPVVVADSTSATANAYSSRIGGMIAYKGDSTLFVDPMSLSMLVIDPHGKVGRVMAVPKASDAAFLIGGPFGWPGFDATGHLVYRTMLRPKMPAGLGAAGGNGKLAMPSMPDSAPIIRFDLDTRRADTAAYIHPFVPRVSVAMNDGRVSVTTTVNPLPIVDDWALMPDATIAIVRGHEYRVDFLKPDGSVVRGPVIPFAWQRLTDADKERVLDSAKTAIQAARARVSAMMGSGSGGTNTTGAPGGPGATAPPAGGMIMVPMVVTRGPGDASPPASGARGGANGGAPPLPTIETVPASELPDYRPAFTAGALRADADGSLWIRTTQVANGGPVYDVVNGSGALVDRVQLPPGRTIAGFGPGGVVYLAVRDGAKGVRLERARVR